MKRKAPGDNDGYYYESALLTAFARGDHGVLAALNAVGAKINPNGKVGKIAVMQAILKGNINILKFLIDHGVSLRAEISYQDRCDNRAYNPWGIAIATSNIKIIKILLDNGVDFNGPVPYREYEDNKDSCQSAAHSFIAQTQELAKIYWKHETAISIAIERGEDELSDLLLKYDLNPKCYGKYFTPITSAVRKYKANYFDILVSRGFLCYEDDYTEDLNTNTLIYDIEDVTVTYAFDQSDLSNEDAQEIFKIICKYWASTKNTKDVDYFIGMAESILDCYSSDILSQKVKDYFVGNYVGDMSRLSAEVELASDPENLDHYYDRFTANTKTIFKLFLSVHIVSKVYKQEEELSPAERGFFASSDFQHAFAGERFYSLYERSNTDKTFSQFLSDLNLNSHRESLENSLLASAIPAFFGFNLLDKTLLEEIYAGFKPGEILSTLSIKECERNINDLTELMDLYKQPDYVEKFLERLINSPDSLPIQTPSVIIPNYDIVDILIKFLDTKEILLSSSQRISIEKIINKVRSYEAALILESTTGYQDLTEEGDSGEEDAVERGSPAANGATEDELNPKAINTDEEISNKELAKPLEEMKSSLPSNSNLNALEDRLEILEKIDASEHSIDFVKNLIESYKTLSSYLNSKFISDFVNKGLLFAVSKHNEITKDSNKAAKIEDFQSTNPFDPDFSPESASESDWTRISAPEIISGKESFHSFVGINSNHLDGINFYHNEVMIL